MESNKINIAIRERLNPNVFHWGYLALKPIVENLKIFSKKTQEENVKIILDLGCGAKPYESVFSFAEKFVGFDVEKNERVDFIGFNWDLPFHDNEFDALISTQVLEHTAKITETVSEIRRVVKNNGLIFISVPFAFPIHGTPYDYYRFTKYGLTEIFKDFELIEITPLNGYINTQLRLVNIFLNHIPFSKYFLFPVFFVNNILAILSDNIFKIVFSWFGKRGKIIYDNVYMSMPENYAIVLRNNK
jgi:SAM-dependent methyltransferase